MNFRRLLFISCFCVPIALVACGNNGAAEKAVRNILNDPNSAIFSNMAAGAEKGSVCGLVNAKNRMGGYVGATPFFYRASGQVAILSAPSDSDFRMLWLRMKLPGVSDDDIVVRAVRGAAARETDFQGHGYSLFFLIWLS